MECAWTVVFVHVYLYLCVCVSLCVFLYEWLSGCTGLLFASYINMPTVNIFTFSIRWHHPLSPSREKDPFIIRWTEKGLFLHSHLPCPGPGARHTLCFSTPSWTIIIIHHPPFHHPPSLVLYHIHIQADRLCSRFVYFVENFQLIAVTS